MRSDTAQLLKRFFFCERSLLISEASWIPAIASLEIKTNLARYVWHYPFPLNESAMSAASGLVEGEHDFTSFAAVDPQRGSEDAKASNVLGPPFMPTPADTARAASLCTQ